MGGLISGFVDELHDKLEERHAKDDALKKEKRESFLKGAMNPDATDEMRQYNWDEYSKLAGPGSKPGIKKMGDFVGKIFKHGKAQAQQDPQASGGAAPQQGPTPAPTSGQGPAQATPQGSPQTAQAPQADAKKRFYDGPQLPTPEQIDARKNAAVKYKSDLDRDAKIAEEKAKPQKLTPVMVQIKGSDKPVQALRNGEGQYFDVNSGDKLEDIDKEMPKESAKGGYIRSVPHSVGLKDARKQAEGGAEFPGADGKMIDLASLPEDMGLQAMVRGNEMFWVPITPTQKTVTVGNVVYGTNPYQVQDIGKTGPDAPVALGQGRTGSTSTPTQVVVDNAGVPHAMGATNTPNTPGAKPAGPPSGQPPAKPAGGQGQGAPPAPVSAPSSPRAMQGVPLATYNKQREDIKPVRVGVAQLFGDTSNPDFKGLVSYAPIADDKGSQQRIGAAFNLVMKGIESEGGSSAHANAGGVGISLGDVGSLLANWADVPNRLAKSDQEQYAKVYGAMSSQEKEALNATFEALSTAVGARKLTGASSAQFSTKALERDVPIIGRSAFSSDEYYDKLGRFAELIKNGAAGTFPQVWQPGELERINKLPTEMQKLKKKGPAKAPASAGPKTAEDYLKSIGVK